EVADRRRAVALVVGVPATLSVRGDDGLAVLRERLSELVLAPARLGERAPVVAHVRVAGNVEVVLTGVEVHPVGVTVAVTDPVDVPGDRVGGERTLDVAHTGAGGEVRERRRVDLLVVYLDVIDRRVGAVVVDLRTKGPGQQRRRRRVQR